ncbi:N-acetylglucosamine-6-phosphate deacetylase [Silvibacterium acidisoli]|uniref:N-acetylglucosamine-6-phosphate deacetylase n=1 Tax=Acidobacteriaceae bacterium ZG23-2 TaxID=2883246 RepID=UPI00406BE2C0
MPTIITADRLINSGHSLEQPVVVIEDGVITRIGTRKDMEVPAGEQLDFPGGTLLPSYFDIHIHGSKNHDVMEATPETFSTIGNFLAGHGVGSYLATTVTAPWDATLRSLEGMAKLIGTEIEGARPLGIHLEGPFLSPHRKGAHPEDLLVIPTVEKFNELWEAAAGQIRLMTIAPELPNALDVIARAKSLGVRISMGHTNADTAEAKAGVKAGADSATHTFNAMRPLDHRNPGIVGEVLTNDDLYAELICDGLHVEPECVRIYWRSKGAKRAILITDAMAAAGMPDGHYKLGQLDVQVKDGVCTLDGDARVLAGSVLTLDKAVKNFASFTGAKMEDVANLVGPNPARMTGFEDRTGALAVGRSADVTVLNAANEVAATILRGQRIH